MIFIKENKEIVECKYIKKDKIEYSIKIDEINRKAYFVYNYVLANENNIILVQCDSESERDYYLNLIVDNIKTNEVVDFNKIFNEKLKKCEKEK